MAKRKSKANATKSNSKKEDEVKKKKTMITNKNTNSLAGPSKSNSVAKKAKASNEDILGNVSYRRKTRTGMERTDPSGSVGKRKGTQLEENEQSGEASVFLDKLIGDRNDDLAKFARAIVHYQLEAQLQLKKKYKLLDGEEDDYVARGSGSFLERDNFEDNFSADEDADEDDDASADANAIVGADVNANVGADANASVGAVADDTQTMVGAAGRSRGKDSGGGGGRGRGRGRGRGSSRVEGRGGGRGVLLLPHSIQPASSPPPSPQPQLQSRTQSSHSGSEGGSHSAIEGPPLHVSLALSGVGASSSSPRRKRGRTRNPKVATLRPGEKLQLQIFCNTIVGDHAQSFVTQCGVWARESTILPLQVKGFNRITPETKDRLWQLVQDKFDFSDEIPDSNSNIRKIVMSQLRKSYASYKCELKKQYYKKFETDEERLQHPPPDVSIEDWTYLVHMWGTPESQAMSERNKHNRSKLGSNHTSGTISYQRKRYKMIQEGAEPDPVEFFKITHTKKDGSAVDKASEEAMAKMLELTIQALQGSISLTPDEIFEKVMGPERHRRVRGHERGSNSINLFSQSLTRQEFQREVEERMQLEVARAKEEMQVQMQAEAQALVQAQVQAEVAQAKADMQTQMAEMQAQMLAHQAQMQRMMEQMSRQMRSAR